MSKFSQQQSLLGNLHQLANEFSVLEDKADLGHSELPHLKQLLDRMNEELDQLKSHIKENDDITVLRVK